MLELSASKISCYKKCPRLYELKYIHGLSPVTESPALSLGSEYHSKIALILKSQSYDHTGLSGCMAEAFEKYIPFHDWGQVETEKYFHERLSRGIYLTGYMDGVLKDGTPIEHKTTGVSSIDSYINHLAYDDQISLYLLVAGKQLAYYTIIQKPRIKQKINESEEDYFKRLREWFTAEQVMCINVTRTQSELYKFQEELIYLSKQIKRARTFWRNPSACSLMPCAYAPICLNYTEGDQVIGYENTQSE